MATTERFPGYDVMAKRNTMSWNEATRRAVDARLTVQDRPEFFTHEEFAALRALCDRILPQEREPKIPVAGMIDKHLLTRGDTGTRYDPMPYDGECWRIGLAALDAEALERCGRGLHAMTGAELDQLLTDCQNGRLQHAAWRNLPPEMFFKRRILADIPAMYYSHPLAWNEIGFGGPASPRGYVRLQANRRDRWEAAEAYPGEEEAAVRANARLR